MLSVRVMRVQHCPSVSAALLAIGASICVSRSLSTQFPLKCVGNTAVSFASVCRLTGRLEYRGCLSLDDDRSSRLGCIPGGCDFGDVLLRKMYQRFVSNDGLQKETKEVAERRITNDDVGRLINEVRLVAPASRSPHRSSQNHVQSPSFLIYSQHAGGSHRKHAPKRLTLQHIHVALEGPTFSKLVL